MNKKLKIDGMKVKSFVTSIEDQTMNTCKGGLEPIKITIESPDCGRETRYPICQWA